MQETCVTCLSQTQINIPPYTKAKNSPSCFLYTIWPFLVTVDVYPPFRKTEQGIKDSRGKTVSLFPEIKRCLQDLKDRDIPIAIASRAGGIQIHAHK